MPRLIILFFLYLSVVSFFSSALFAFELPAIERHEYYRADVPKPWMIVHAVRPDFYDRITGVKYMPDGEQLLVTSDSGELALVKITTGQTVWVEQPFPEDNTPLKLLVVAPDGKSFVTAGGATETKQAALNIHSTSNGQIIKQIREDSVFYQSNLSLDHRKPGAREIQERTEIGLGAYWLAKPYAAEYNRGGTELIVQFCNNMTGPDLYDRFFISYETGTYKKLWQWQLVTEYDKDSQPAGFVISLPFPSIIHESLSGNYLYGTPHAEIRLLDKATIQQGNSQVDIYKKKEGPLWQRVASRDNGLDEMGMGVNSMVKTPDNQYLVVSAGEPGYTVIVTYDLKTHKEVYRSNVFDSHKISLSPNGEVMAATSYSSTSPVYLFDVIRGKLLYMGPYFGGAGEALLELNPRYREACFCRGGKLFILRERRAISLKLTDKWQKTGLYLKPGVALHAFGEGEIEISTNNVPDAERWSVSENEELYFGEGDGRNNLPEDKTEWGEVYLRTETAGEWLIYGGLTREEFVAVDKLRLPVNW
jgi:WD40 repeat protein